MPVKGKVLPGKNMVVAIYYHPEGYPPTLNAIQCLSNTFEKIALIYRPHLKGSWDYPAKVELVPSGTFIHSKDQEKSSIFLKLRFFWRFCLDLLGKIKEYQPEYILVYDPLALLAYSWIRPFIGFPHKIWYHNHDIVEPDKQRKYSLGWFSVKMEKKIFPKLDIFSLPTKERLPFFDMNVFRGQFFYIPNYPSKHFYDQFYSKPNPVSEVRIIFQGRIGPGHGIEELIPVLNKRVNGKKLVLVLKGYCEPSYLEYINNLLAKWNATAHIEMYPYTDYKEVPRVASGCHIGIAIFAKQDIMNKTLGTSSNKIYEYAALGLPVLYYEKSNVGQVLSQYEWAFPVNLEPESIFNSIEKIINHYSLFSEKAYHSFSDGLNFENHFATVLEYLAQEKAVKQA